MCKLPEVEIAQIDDATIIGKDHREYTFFCEKDHVLTRGNCSEILVDDAHERKTVLRLVNSATVSYHFRDIQ
jgi:hypothetical protein